jgi:hypothetical protein
MTTDDTTSHVWANALHARLPISVKTITAATLLSRFGSNQLVGSVYFATCRTVKIRTIQNGKVSSCGGQPLSCKDYDWLDFSLQARPSISQNRLDNTPAKRRTYDLLYHLPSIRKS